MKEAGPAPDRYTDEYEIFKAGVPHHEEFQDKVGEIVREYVKKILNNNIVAIDGGMGTGFTAKRLLNADPRIHVIGIDNEQGRLRKARAELAPFEGRVDYIQGDMLEELRLLPNASADIFSSVLTIHNFPPPYREQLFNEIARVLKAGGLFVNGDKYAHDDENMHRRAMEAAFKDYDAYAARGRPDLKPHWIAHDLTDEEIKITESEQTRLLTHMGFHDVTWEYREKMHAVVKAIP